MRNKNLWAFAFLAIFPLAGFSQTSFSSPFNIFGLGERAGDAKVWQRSMGGTGIGLRDPYQINILNPAATTSYEMTSLSIDVRHRYVWQSGRGVDEPLLNQNTQLMSFDLGMKITDWWGTSLTMSQFSSPKYDIRTRDSIEDFGNVVYRFSGAGNVNKLTFANGFKPMKNLSVGLNTHFIFGGISYTNEVVFENSQFYGSQQSDNLRYKDILFDFGAQYHTMLGKRYYLTLGATYTPTQTLQSTYTRQVNTFIPLGMRPPVDTAVFSSGDNNTTRIESQLGLGFSLSKISDRVTSPGWTISGDYRLINGSEYTHFDGTMNMANGYSAHIGASLIPRYAFSKLDRGRSYFNDVVIRAGAYQMQTPMLIEGFPVMEQAVTFGLSLPFRPRNLGPGEQKLNYFNLGIVVGNRGNGNTDVMSEEFVHLNFGVVFSDRWFRKFKYR